MFNIVAIFPKYFQSGQLHDSGFCNMTQIYTKCIKENLNEVNRLSCLVLCHKCFNSAQIDIQNLYI
jgi:hypothetical protein